MKRIIAVSSIIAIAVGMSVSAQAESQTFKMYAQPNAVVNPQCDVYTEAVLDIEGNAGVVTLTNRLAGFCEIYIAPNERSYPVTGTDDGCGSMIFKQDAGTVGAIEVTDNRNRLCENVIPAIIVIKETNEAGQVRESLYSKD